jgi:F0F1-type ATP synthase membrane subunit c/vacuolar-type H+-ATPase subunit K
VIVLVLVTAGAGLALSILAWLTRSGSPVHLTASAIMLVALLVNGVLLLTGDGVRDWGEGSRDGLLLLVGALAVSGGGPLTSAVLWLVDRGNTPKNSTQRAGEVLRGGAVIGALERGAIYAALVAGWPEGIAVVLAVKGLARYPELRAPDQPGIVTPQAVAERFIIGTFISVLWSVTCGGLLLS